MSTRKSYDFVVIGGGSAGYAAARTAVDLGLQTAVVDGADPLGGLCILRGCMPSKTLIESANRNLSIRRAREFGLRAENLGSHPAEIRDRKRRLIGEFASYRQGQLEDGRFDLHRGAAAFVDAHTVEVSPRDGGDTYRLGAASSLVATGSVIPDPPVPGLAEAGYLTSDDILDAGSLPASLIVLGGGAIALEMAHYLEGIGKGVTVIQRSEQVLRSVDRDVATALEDAFRKRGIELYTGTRITGVTRDGRSKRVTFEHGGERRSVEAEEVLCALGRRPASGGLGLDAAGVSLDRGRIETSPEQATSVPHIFAAGDVCGPHEVVHIAIEQGEIAAHNAALQLDKLASAHPRRIDYRLKLFGVFTEPQVASVGLGEREAGEAGLDHLTASYPFDDHGKSMTMGETEGFVKLVCAPDGEILGASCVGPEAVELIHEVVVAMHFRAKAADLAQIPHYHPTLSEIWTYPAEEIADQVHS